MEAQAGRVESSAASIQRSGGGTASTKSEVASQNDGMEAESVSLETPDIRISCDEAVLESREEFLKEQTSPPQEVSI